MGKEIDITIDGKVAGRVVGCDRIADIAPFVAQEPEVFVVYDENASWIASEVIAAVPGVRGSIAIDATEEEKSMETVLLITRSLLEAGASRKALVLAIGGGITTDLAGFAASIYKRGVRYANVPTTLLAQVDAAIGGKTGVNFDDYKNMLGVIVQPSFTFVCADALRTLPRRDFLSGAAELALFGGRRRAGARAGRRGGEGGRRLARSVRGGRASETEPWPYLRPCHRARSAAAGG